MEILAKSFRADERKGAKIWILYFYDSNIDEPVTMYFNLKNPFFFKIYLFSF